MRAFTFEVVGQDCTVQLCSEHTVFDLMRVVCAAWLDEARDGDGDVCAHTWMVKVHVDGERSHARHVGPYEAFEEDDVVESAQSSSSLGGLNLSAGSQLIVDYDMGSTTRFSIRVVSESDISDADAALCPRVVSEDASAIPMAIYAPPVGTPTLDDCFPNLAALALASSTTWVLLGPMSKSCTAAIEAGPNAMGDLLFAPHRFSSVEELLLTADAAASEQPDASTREDAFSRMIFPVKMGKADENKYKKLVKELTEFDAAMAALGANAHSFSAMSRLSQKHQDMAMGPAQVAVQLSAQDLDAKRAALIDRGLNFSAAFPGCAALLGDAKAFRWLSYRRGVLRLCQGDGRDTGERGVPPPGGELAKLSRRVGSLHELFCVAESLCRRP